MKPENVDATLDARGLLCPMPVVKASKSIQPLMDGEILEILATDKGAAVDIPAWCSARKNTLVHSEHSEGVYRFYIKKGS